MIIEMIVSGLEWFTTNYPLLAYTFDGTVFTFFGIGLVELLRGKAK